MGPHTLHPPEIGNNKYEDENIISLEPNDFLYHDTCNIIDFQVLTIISCNTTARSLVPPSIKIEESKHPPIQYNWTYHNHSLALIIPLTPYHTITWTG